MIQWTPQKLKKMQYICMRNWKNYGSYVSWNLKSSCQTQENCSIEYPLRKELSKIISYHQQRHLKLFGWQKRIHLNVDDNFSYTRRNFLKKISTLIDPLGMLTPSDQNCWWIKLGVQELTVMRKYQIQLSSIWKSGFKSWKY